MDKYINLDQLSIATQALLKKINEQSDLKVDRDEVISLNPIGDIIANIGGINIANGVKFNDVIDSNGNSLVVDGKAVIPPAIQPIYVQKDSQEDTYYTNVSYNDIGSMIQAQGTSIFLFQESDSVNQIFKFYTGYFYQYVVQSQDQGFNFISFDYDEFNQNNNLKIYNWKFSLDTETESNDHQELPPIITKTEVSTGGGSVQSDWEETDSTDPSYIENKPQIHKSVGNNSILLGDPTSLSSKPEFIVHITGAAKASVYTYSQDDDANIPESTTGYSNIICGIYTAEIDSINKTTRTITLKNKQTISTSAASNKEATIYYQSIAARSGLVGGSTTAANASASSFAWGNHASSNGGYSFSFGQQVYANGTQSFALGGPNSISNGNSSLAVGGTVTATGDYSQAFGQGNTANKRSQLVFGRWNQYEADDDPTAYGTYVEIVGNGASISSKSNARTLDWSGNEVLAGKLTIGQGPVNNMDVTTKQYVDNAIGQAGSGLPEVTNEDIGKALKVVQDTGDDIIPQQSITIQAGASSAVIQNYDITKFVAGTPVRLTLSNEEHDFTVSSDSIISNNNNVTFYSEQDIEHEDPVATISYGNNQLIFDQLWQTEESLELNIHLQTLEPQWQPDRINELPNPEIIPPIDETGWQWSNLGKSPIVNDNNIYNLINQSIALQSSDFVYNSDYGLYSVNVATDSENKFKPGNILTVGLVSQGEINQYDSQCIIAEATPGYPYNYYSYLYNVSIGVTSQGQIDLFVHSEPTNIISIENVNIIEPKWELQSSPIVFNFVEDTFNHRAEFDPLFYNTQTDIVTLSKQFRYFMHSSYPVQIHLRTQDSDGDTTNYILNKLPTLIGLNNPDFSTIITHADTNRIGTIRFRPSIRSDQGEYISYGTINYYNYQLLPGTANNGDIMRYDSSSSLWQTASLPIYDGSVLINASGVYF